MTWLKAHWKELLAATVLLIATGSHPYAYYQITRWIVCIISIVLAYEAYRLEKQNWTVVFCAIAILFNPLIPFFFAKETWQILDLGSAVVLVYSAFKFHRS